MKVEWWPPDPVAMTIVFLGLCFAFILIMFTVAVKHASFECQNHVPHSYDGSCRDGARLVVIDRVAVCQCKVEP